MIVATAPERTITSLPRVMPLAGERVALFSGAYNHIADGVSLTLNRLVAHLQRSGAEVEVFAPTIPRPALRHEGRLNPVRSTSMPGRKEYRISLGLNREPREALDAFAPTLIHIATPDLLGLSALRYARANKLPVVATYHTHFASYLRYYGLGFAEGPVWRYLKRFYDACDAVYVPTPSMADVLRENGITKGLRIWPRGVETERFSPERRSMDWRRAQGISDDELVVTFVGRLVWEKGLDVFAKVMEQLQGSDHPVRALLVGEGPAKAELQERLPGEVFTGHLSGTDLATAYASSDIFLFPSETETFGNVTLEAMASGVPAVCADAVGSRALVADGETGILAPPRDTEAFKAAVTRLLEDSTIRSRKSTAARDRALNYSWPCILDRMVDYYQDVLQPSGDSLPGRAEPCLPA
jgi:glycosyltransferase involved in cell wall biosynthesis